MHVQETMLELPSCSQILARFPVELSESLKEPHIQTLRHRRAVVREFHNKDVVVSAKLAKFFGPTVTMGCILQDDERTCGVQSAPKGNYPCHEHVSEELLVIRAGFGRKNFDIFSLEMLSVNSRREWDSGACRFSPRCRS